MVKLTINKIKKTLSLLLVVFFIVSLTAAAAAADCPSGTCQTTTSTVCNCPCPNQPSGGCGDQHNCGCGNQNNCGCGDQHNCYNNGFGGNNCGGNEIGFTGWGNNFNFGCKDLFSNFGRMNQGGCVNNCGHTW